MNFSRISALYEVFAAKREGSAMLGLPHRSIFTDEVKIGEHGPRQAAQMVGVLGLPGGKDVFHRPGVGIPLHQEPPWGQVQCLRKVYWGRDLQDPHAVDAGQDRHRPGRHL